MKTSRIMKKTPSKVKVFLVVLRIYSFCEELNEKILLEQSCCKKRQNKSPGQETGLGNRRRLKVLKDDIKLVLKEHE